MVGIVRKFLLFTVPIAAGYGIMQSFTFTDEQVYKALPEHRKQEIDDVKRKDPKTNLTHAQMVGLMLKQNFESNRPAWDVRPLDLSKVTEEDIKALHDGDSVNGHVADSAGEDKKKQTGQGSRFYK
jgi:hypothetical protein